MSYVGMSETDDLKAEGLDAYKAGELRRALSLFRQADEACGASGGASGTDKRWDIVCNIATTLFELGEYVAAAEAAGEAQAGCAGVGDDKRAKRMGRVAAKARAAWEGAELGGFVDSGAAKVVVPWGVHLPQPTRMSARDGWSYIPVGHEAPHSVLARKGEFFLTRLAANARKILTSTPLWFVHPSLHPAVDTMTDAGIEFDRSDLSLLKRSASTAYATAEPLDDGVDFRVLLAASSDCRHTLHSVLHVKSAWDNGDLAGLADGDGAGPSDSAGGGSSSNSKTVEIMVNDLVPDVMARQVLLLALCARNTNTGIDLASLSGLAFQDPYTLDDAYHSFMFHFMTAHNLSVAQHTFLINVLTDVMIPAAACMETWNQVWGGKVDVDRLSSLQAIAAVWKLWVKIRYNLDDPGREWSGLGKDGFAAGGGDSMGGDVFDSLSALLPKPRKPKVEKSAAWLEAQAKGEPDVLRCRLEEWITQGLLGSVAELQERGDAKAATKYMTYGRNVLFPSLPSKSLDELRALATKWGAKKVYSTIDMRAPSYFVPKVRKEHEFYEASGLLAPPRGLDPGVVGTASMTRGELMAAYVLNPSYVPSHAQQMMDIPAFDTLELMAGSLASSLEGTLAYRGMRLMARAAEAMQAVTQDTAPVRVRIRASVGNMLDVFRDARPGSVDRVFVSNVPDYMGWLPVFASVSVMFRPGPQAFIMGTALMDPPLWDSWEHVIESSSLLPLSVASDVFGLRRMWGDDIKVETDVAFEALGPVTFPHPSLSASVVVPWVKRLLVRAAYTSPMGTFQEMAKPLELVSASTPAYVIHHLLAVNKVPLHVLAPFVASVLQDPAPSITVKFATPSDRTTRLASMLSSKAKKYPISHIVPDFTTALVRAFGGTGRSPFALQSPLPSLVQLVLRTFPLWAKFDHPSLQLHIVLSHRGGAPTPAFSKITESLDRSFETAIYNPGPLTAAADACPDTEYFVITSALGHVDPLSDLAKKNQSPFSNPPFYLTATLPRPLAEAIQASEVRLYIAHIDFSQAWMVELVP